MSVSDRSLDASDLPVARCPYCGHRYQTTSDIPEHRDYTRFECVRCTAPVSLRMASDVADLDILPHIGAYAVDVEHGAIYLKALSADNDMEIVIALARATVPRLVVPRTVLEDHRSNLLATGWHWRPMHFKAEDILPMLLGQNIQIGPTDQDDRWNLITTGHNRRVIGLLDLEYNGATLHGDCPIRIATQLDAIGITVNRMAQD